MDNPGVGHTSCLPESGHHLRVGIRSQRCSGALFSPSLAEKRVPARSAAYFPGILSTYSLVQSLSPQSLVRLLSAPIKDVASIVHAPEPPPVPSWRPAAPLWPPPAHSPQLQAYPFAKTACRTPHGGLSPEMVFHFSPQITE